MDTKQKQDKRDKLTTDFDAQIAFLQSQINNKTVEFNNDIKKIQDQIDELQLQSDALKALKIK